MMIVQEEREAQETRDTGTMERIIKRERWPGEYVGGQRVQSVPLVTPGQQVPANQPVLRLERRTTTNSQELSSVERRDEVVPAGLDGRVLGITPRGGVLIESYASVVPGVVGFGNQVTGVLTTMHVRDENGISGEMSKLPAGAILAIPEPLTFTVLRRAIISGVVGIIGSSIAFGDLEGFLQNDLLSLLESMNVEHAHLPALTLMLTEGVGQIPMATDTLEMLQRHQGAIVLLSGMTSTRYHITPELLISSQYDKQEHSSQQEREETKEREEAKDTEDTEDTEDTGHHSFSVGTRVRVMCGNQEGATGTIEYFFMHEQLFPSGIMSRAVRLRLDNGTLLMVPLIHIQRLDYT